MANTFIDPDLVSAVLDLRQGDHLCLLYDSDPAEQLPAILPYIRQGIANGERCIYVADDLTLGAFREALSGFGIDVEAEEKRGSLFLWTRKEWRPPGQLSSARKAEQVRAIIDEALAEGFTGIRFGVEMTWTLGPSIDAESVRYWEATLNAIFTPDLPARIVCQYSRRRLSPEVIEAGICTHPLVLIGQELCSNPFYQAPLILNDSSYAGAAPSREQVDWLISQLRWARALDREHEQRIRAEATASEAGELTRLNAELEAVTAKLKENEEDLEDFFQNGIIGLHWVGPDGTILRANQAELKMLGYDESEYIGHNIADFHVDRHVVEDIVRRLHAGETLHDYESRLICKDGSIRTVLIDSSVLWRNGKFVHSRCFTKDITDRHKADEAAYRLSALVESSDDAIVGKDLTGIVNSWNQGAERLFGYSADEMIGQSIRRIIPADRQDEEDAVLRTIRGGERVDHFETVRQRKDGSLVPVSLTISPVIDAAGKIIGASKIARDITERKATEEAIQRSIILKDQFLGLVSHELRTPIATIIGNGQILQRSWDRLTEEDRNQAIGDVVSQGERLQSIVENLLLLTRFEAGELKSEALDLSRLSEEAMEALRKRSPQRTISLERDGECPLASADSTLTRLVIDNFLGNADKYSPPGTAIELVIGQDESGLPSLRVLDRAIGVEEGEEDRIFEPFYRSSSARSRAAGMGLGLAVCKRIIDAQRGSISALRRPGGGSEFCFVLPRA